MKSKQQIYADILNYGISFIRGHSQEAEVCFSIADLLHNIPHCMLSPDFEENDFYFLNFDAPGYRAYCQFKKIRVNLNLLAMIDELRNIVPLDLRSRLEHK